MARPLSTTMGSSGVDNKEDIQRFVDLGRLSASLIHEISSPLTAALIHLESSDQPLSVPVVKRCLVDLSRYVDAARQQLRGESGQAYFFIDVQMRYVKRLVLPLARQVQVKLEFYNIPHLKLSGDPVKFQQIVVNLIVNAIEAYKDTDGTNSTKLVKVDFTQYSRSLTLKVTDHGEGIKPNQLVRIFQPFYSTKSRSNKGLGLGLVIVKRYIEQDFRGSIKASSNPKSGTRFVIKFLL
jgi:two-component system C4-dicarboxylate transport sensor histidine kinase DctB